MRNNWKKCKLSNIADVRDGTHESPKEVLGRGFPLVTSRHIHNGKVDLSNTYKISETDFIDINKRSKVDQGDILISMIGTVGQLAYIAEKPLYAIKNVGLIKPFDKCISKYIFYYLISPFAQAEISTRLKGTTQQYLSLGELRNFPIYLPPIEEQKRIAGVLGAFDDKIELLQKQNTTLENMAKALFKSWFVDFDVVYAKQQGQPKAAVMQQYHLTEELYNLFPSSFEPSALGPIPTGWQVKALDNLANLVLGGTPSRVKKSYWDNGTIPWINSGKINDFRITNASEYITQDGYDHSATKMMPKRTTLVAITGATLGAVSLTEIECCANQSVVGIVATQKLPSEYVYPWILFNMDALLAKQTGGAQQHINKNDVASLLVLLPSSSILKSYVESVANLYNKITCNVKQIQTLTEMRDALLPRLISDKIRV